ncbi:MAG TPA: hypothetical protein GXZ90_01755, partial [Clostridiales bacterium]|nr:hypothetical protein [Clostridiales bacterium]
MKKQIKIIISILFAIVILIGSTVFIKKIVLSPVPDKMEVNALDTNTSSDDSEAQSNDKDSVSPDTTSIDASVSLQETNSWQSGESTYIIQIDGTITNNSKTVINDWKVTVPMASQASINDSWNMNYDL